MKWKAVTINGTNTLKETEMFYATVVVVIPQLYLGKLIKSYPLNGDIL